MGRQQQHEISLTFTAGSVCLYICGVGGEWVGDLDQGREGWCYVCVRCEYGLSV